MANPEKYECIFVIGRKVSDQTYSWMISLLDYDRVKAVTIFNFEDRRVTLHEAGGFHHLEEFEKILETAENRELMAIVLLSYLVRRRQDIYQNIFEGEQLDQLPPVAFISISSHSFLTGLNPWYEDFRGAVSYTRLLTNWDLMLNHRDEIRTLLSPDCVVKLWGCEGIDGDELPTRTMRACLQLDWDEKQGNSTFFHPELYSPPPPDDDPTFFEIMRRNRARLDEALREEFDYLTARNIIKYAFLGENPEMIVPAVTDGVGKIRKKKEKVEAGYMKDYVYYPVALARFLDRPVIAGSFGMSAEKHDINPDKLSLLKEIKDSNVGNAFPGLGGYFSKVGDQITMPVDVECPVIDLLISRWVTPSESIQVPSVLLSMDFPSERYVVYRSDISLSNVEFQGRTALLEKPSILDYPGTEETLLKSGDFLTYPGINDY